MNGATYRLYASVAIIGSARKENAGDNSIKKMKSPEPERHTITVGNTEQEITIPFSPQSDEEIMKVANNLYRVVDTHDQQFKATKVTHVMHDDTPYVVFTRLPDDQQPLPPAPKQYKAPKPLGKSTDAMKVFDRLTNKRQKPKQGGE